MENKNEWKKVKLGEITTITMGQSPKSEFYNLEGDISWLLQRTFLMEIQIWERNIQKLINTTENTNTAQKMILL